MFLHEHVAKDCSHGAPLSTFCPQGTNRPTLFCCKVNGNDARRLLHDDNNTESRCSFVDSGS
jgi:hypothetical protein